jgi:ABC-type multidrug transport system fused ATPase/permease subunit
VSIITRRAHLSHDFYPCSIFSLGKSTILQIVMRFYEITGGSATVDGMEFSEMNVNNLRKQIGYVGQMPILFNTTVRKNILLGKPDATEAEVIAAAKAAHAHTFIMDLSDGYDTELGPSGSLLSGGQKQRIAIARGIISNPQILVLDEATGKLSVLYITQLYGAS